MRERWVVTSFLTISTANELAQGDKVLLLKRSDKVGTYQHHWAAVSGSIEPTDTSPLSRALTEIQEETTLTLADVELVRVGRVLTIHAPKLSTVWKVRPFLFRVLCDASKIAIDWEHEKYEWISPDELVNYQTVPNLVEAFYRVYLPEQVHNSLMDMYNNRSSGAQQLAAEALNTMEEVVRLKSMRTYCKNAKEMFYAMLNIGWYFTHIRPTMKAPIIYAVGQAMSKSREILKQSGGEISVEEYEQKMLDIIDGIKQSSKDADRKIINHFLQLTLNAESFPSHLHVMTISHSSTIYSSLLSLIQSIQSLPDHTLKITIMESRPLNEGSVGLARKLLDDLPETAKPRVEIQIITDASCAYFMPTVTHVIIGADRIAGKDATVINKIGSFPLALSAKYYDKPIIVVTRTDKLASTDEGEQLEENAAEEVVSMYENWSEFGTSKNVRVRNVYFESLESKLINGYVTEHGILNANDIVNLWQERKDDEKLFDLLEE
ncbi:8103_t:CDS:2 [Paraglomus occultum]|uniref:8103_t:CDS:1 n=1 Tax=Paraglomus occultum TaxID=144539 RepID=A0A9N8W4Y6_9GLOM|nr:8103_t:CDS:2 [Paraglomus occultum]